MPRTHRRLKRKRIGNPKTPKKLPSVGPRALPDAIHAQGNGSINGEGVVFYVTEREAVRVVESTMSKGTAKGRKGRPERRLVLDRLLGVCSGVWELCWEPVVCGYRGTSAFFGGYGVVVYAVRDANGCYRLVVRGEDKSEPLGARE